MRNSTGVLDGKVAIVTGAGQGVGKGVAIALAAEGAAVMLMGRTQSKLDVVAAEIAARGGRAAVVSGDVKVLADIERCVDATVREFGTIDILVNNAQEVPLGYLLEVEDAAVEAGFASGPLATLRFMRLCHPYLRGGGAIVNMASAAGVRPDPIRRGAYAAAKEAVRAFTRAAAVEWGQDGIRVNAILPYAMSPALEELAAAHPAEFDARRLANPMRRIGDAEVDIGRAVVFLVGPDAAYITGATIPVDGGNSFVG
ncbi:MAG TPA: SDR family oxidoreductase [Acidimicrobiales bacterium]|nr:SDR family oxidoreductase [Acidimicrobiales bacterium]